MTTPTTTISNSRALRFFAIGVLVALAAALIAAADSYASNKVDGISADLKQGTLRVKGGDGAQQVALRLKANDPSRIEVDAGDNGSADFTFDRGDVHAIKVKMGDGNDSARIDDANGSFTGGITSDSKPTTIAGGDGNDMLLGAQNPPAGPAANQVEKYKGGAGNDTVDGGRGNDIAYLGEGNDTFRWDPGEGSDVIEGQDGTDTMLFNGAGNAANPVADTVTMSATPGGRLTFSRQPADVTMDTNDVEIVDFNALGGADSITVNDLTGTDVTQTNVDLALTLGGNAPDGVVDTVTNNNGDDTIVSVAHKDATDQLIGPIQLLVD
jgi:Ca2+-binding RTX toxin-like protein